MIAAGAVPLALAAIVKALVSWVFHPSGPGTFRALGGGASFGWKLLVLAIGFGLVAHGVPLRGEQTRD